MEEHLRECTKKLSKKSLSLNDVTANNDTPDSCKMEIDSLKKNLNQKDMEIISLKRDLSMKEQRIEVLKERLQDGDFGKMVDKLELKLTNTIIANKEEMERKLIYYISHRSLYSDLKEFVWKYHDLSIDQRDQFSDDFYINGYRLSLCLNLTRGKIALWCQVIQGSNDNNLQWPLKDRVTLSILNQKTFKPFKSEPYQYDSYFSKYRWVFERPQWERNNKSRIGTYGFVEYSEIVDIDSIIIKDSIVVSCSVDRL